MRPRRRAVSTPKRMTLTAILCFAAIVLAASLRAFVPRRPSGDRHGRPRRSGAGVVLGGPVPTLDLIRGDRRSGAAATPMRLTGSGGDQGAGGRIGD